MRSMNIECRGGRRRQSCQSIHRQKMRVVLVVLLTAVLCLCKGETEEENKKKTCTEGEVWKEDCNNCHCDNGLAACTRMGCPPTGKKGCTPGTAWKEDCHSCMCEADGKPVCSRELCKGQGIQIALPPIKNKMKSECVPGTSWKEDCNDCHCTAKGIEACTRMECPPKPKY